VGTPPPPPPAPPPAASPILFVLDLGYDWGETRIMRLSYTDGTSDELDANDGWFASAGAAFLRYGRPGDLAADAVATLGIKYKRIGINEGNMRYLTYPLEVMGRLWLRQLRVGAGVNVALSPSFKGGGIFDGKVELDRAVGFIGTVEWIPSYASGRNAGGLGVRILRQELQNAAGVKTSANAIGILLRVEG
jgi:hypothetical protein